MGSPLLITRFILSTHSCPCSCHKPRMTLILGTPQSKHGSESRLICPLRISICVSPQTLIIQPPHRSPSPPAFHVSVTLPSPSSLSDDPRQPDLCLCFWHPVMGSSIHSIFKYSLESASLRHPAAPFVQTLFLPPLHYCISFLTRLPAFSLTSLQPVSCSPAVSAISADGRPQPASCSGPKPWFYQCRHLRNNHHSQHPGTIIPTKTLCAPSQSILPSSPTSTPPAPGNLICFCPYR